MHGDAAPDNIADDVADAQTPPPDLSEVQDNSDDEDEELQAAIRASLEEHNATTSDTPTGKRRPHNSSSDEDDTPARNRARNAFAWDAANMPASGARSRRRSKARDNSASTSSPGSAPTRSCSRPSLSSPEPAPAEDVMDATPRKSPFLHPMASSLLDGDVEEISSDEELSKSSMPPPMRSSPQQQRTVHADDDDEQLQAVIAASLGQTYHVSERILDGTRRALRRESEVQEAPAAPVPEDVKKIRYLRAQAATAPTPAEPTQDPAPADEVPEESAEDDVPSVTPSPEELRRARLRHFG